MTLTNKEIIASPATELFGYVVRNQWGEFYRTVPHPCTLDLATGGQVTVFAVAQAAKESIECMYLYREKTDSGVREKVKLEVLALVREVNP